MSFTELQLHSNFTVLEVRGVVQAVAVTTGEEGRNLSGRGSSSEIQLRRWYPCCTCSL